MERFHDRLFIFSPGGIISYDHAKIGAVEN